MTTIRGAVVRPFRPAASSNTRPTINIGNSDADYLLAWYSYSENRDSFPQYARLRLVDPDDRFRLARRRSGGSGHRSRARRQRDSGFPIHPHEVRDRQQCGAVGEFSVDRYDAAEKVLAPLLCEGFTGAESLGDVLVGVFNVVK